MDPATTADTPLSLGVDPALTWHDHGGRGGRVGAQAEAAAFGQAVAEQGDVLLQAAGVAGLAQLAAQAQSLLLGALGEAGFQEVGHRSVHRFLPALGAKQVGCKRRR